METPEGKCISLFLPTHRMGTETQEDPIRFKNLLRRAEEELIQSGLRAPEARKILEPAQKLLSDSLFWSHQGDGLAAFLTAKNCAVYRLPYSVEEMVVVGNRFHLKPLLPLLSGDGRFYVLALSQNNVRLLQGTRYSISEVDLKGVPRSLADALKYDNPEKQLQFHTKTQHHNEGKGGRRAAIYHGQGNGTDEAKDNILRYLRQVDSGLRDFLNDQNSPLILAGVGYLLPIYREANSYRHLLNGGIEGNPQKLSPEELHRKAWSLVEPYYKKAEEAAAGLLREASGKGRTCEDLPEILSAARRGKVDILFVALDHSVWGTYDPHADRTDVHERAFPGDEDLLDRAALETLSKGGTVFAVPAERVPLEAPLTALFRYS